MVKTTPLDEKTHMFFKKTQIALFEKYKIKATMSDLMADISYALKHPEDAAKLILSARREKQEKVISGENKSKDNNKESGLVFVKPELGGVPLIIWAVIF